MSERITERELRELERQAREYSMLRDDDVRVVDEVRRLRGLIVAALPDIEEAGAWNLEGPIQELRAEARAIREEK